MPQAEKKDLYKKTSERYGIPEELVAEIADAVFQGWADWQRAPDNLRLKVHNLGTQIVRKKKVNFEIKEMYKSTFDYINEDNNRFIDEDQFIRYQDNKEWYQNMLRLKITYSQYLAEKAEIRKIRDELQRPLKDVLEANSQKKDSPEASEDNPKEH